MQLLTETKTYRVEDEDAAIQLIEKFKKEAGAYEVTKSAYTMKTKKSKGEVIEMWYVVSVTLNYNI